MDANSPEHRLLVHLKEALALADQIGASDVAIAIDNAINRAGGDDAFLRDSAARIWVLPD